MVQAYIVQRSWREPEGVTEEAVPVANFDEIVTGFFQKTSTTSNPHSLVLEGRVGDQGEIYTLIFEPISVVRRPK